MHSYHMSDLDYLFGTKLSEFSMIFGYPISYFHIFLVLNIFLMLAKQFELFQSEKKVLETIHIKLLSHLFMYLLSPGGPNPW